MGWGYPAPYVTVRLVMGSGFVGNVLCIQRQSLDIGICKPLQFRWQNGRLSRLSLRTATPLQTLPCEAHNRERLPTSEPSKMGSASEARLSPGVEGLVGLLSMWSNSTRIVTPGLNPNRACCKIETQHKARKSKLVPLRSLLLWTGVLTTHNTRA